MHFYKCLIWSFRNSQWIKHATYFLMNTRYFLWVACTDLSQAVDLKLTLWQTTNRICAYSLQHLLGVKCEERHFQKLALWIYNKHSRRKNVDILRSTVRNWNAGHDLSTPVPWPLTRACDLWKWSPLIILHVSRTDTSTDTAASIKQIQGHVWPDPHLWLAREVMEMISQVWHEQISTGVQVCSDTCFSQWTGKQLLKEFVLWRSQNHHDVCRKSVSVLLQKSNDVIQDLRRGIITLLREVWFRFNFI